MYTQPHILDGDSNEYFQLKVTCQILYELTENMVFKIEDIYYDLGQDWMWTTVVAYNLKDGGSFQCLNPREWAEIINDATNSRIRGICKDNMKEYPRIWNVKKED